MLTAVRAHTDGPVYLDGGALIRSFLDVRAAQAASACSTQMASWNRDPAVRLATVAGPISPGASPAARRLTIMFSNRNATAFSFLVDRPALAQTPGCARRYPRPDPGPLVSRCARATGIRLTTITTSAIAFTIGRFWPWRMKPKRSSGSVFCAPAVK